MTHGAAATTERERGVSTVRLYAMRVLYLLNFAVLGPEVWPELFRPDRMLGPVNGVAFSFWATLSILSLLGLRYPLKMLPLLFVQLTYKAIWLVAVALPLRAAGALVSGGHEMALTFLVGGALDLLVIPWPYVLARYAKEPGDRWKFGRQARDATAAAAAMKNPLGV